ncbi:hypothetical protein CEXT_596821 [Caerostris extrusa]|uniref:Uncharacterized protein n=1 Tax=Caerostris extrusa TaxID=172846 RepID=A0AAV4UTX6_CAEEX|nr:hypothetical protein CEXT_596821 [Caerostris extrusa]
MDTTKKETDASGGPSRLQPLFVRVAGSSSFIHKVRDTLKVKGIKRLEPLCDQFEEFGVAVGVANEPKQNRGEQRFCGEKRFEE